MTSLNPGEVTRLEPGDTLSVTELAAISIDNRFTRIADALERIEEHGEREARAAERTADTLETLTMLFASCIGIGQAYCPGASDETPSVNYLRSGQGDRFRCDRPGEAEDSD